MFNCTIGYIYVVTEPDYEIYDEYPDDIDIIYGNINIDYFNENKKNYTGRLSYYNLYLNHKLTNNCNNKCKLCYDDLEKKCIVCNDGYDVKINKEEKYKICLEETELPLESHTDIPTEEKTNCSIEQIVYSNCNNGYIKNEQYEDLHEKIKENFLNNSTYHGEKII